MTSPMKATRAAATCTWTEGRGPPVAQDAWAVEIEPSVTALTASNDASSLEAINEGNVLNALRGTIPVIQSPDRAPSKP